MIKSRKQKQRSIERKKLSPNLDERYVEALNIDFRDIVEFYTVIEADRIDLGDARGETGEKLGTSWKNSICEIKNEAKIPPNIRRTISLKSPKMSIYSVHYLGVAFAIAVSNGSIELNIRRRNAKSIAIRRIWNNYREAYQIHCQKHLSITHNDIHSAVDLTARLVDCVFFFPQIHFVSIFETNFLSTDHVSFKYYGINSPINEQTYELNFVDPPQTLPISIREEDENSRKKSTLFPEEDDIRTFLDKWLAVELEEFKLSDCKSHEFFRNEYYFSINYTADQEISLNNSTLDFPFRVFQENILFLQGEILDRWEFHRGVRHYVVQKVDTINKIVKNIKTEIESKYSKKNDELHSLLDRVSSIERNAEALMKWTAPYGQRPYDVFGEPQKIESVYDVSETDTLPFSVDYIVESVVKTRSLALGRKIDLQLKRGLVLKFGRVQLEEALEEIIENAIKYSPPDGNIQITLESSVTGGFTITAANNGPALVNDEVYVLPEAGRRGVAAERSGAPGSGFGLTTVSQRLIDVGMLLEYTPTPLSGKSANQSLWRHVVTISAPHEHLVDMSDKIFVRRAGVT